MFWNKNPKKHKAIYAIEYAEVNILWDNIYFLKAKEHRDFSIVVNCVHGEEKISQIYSFFKFWSSNYKKKAS